MRNLQQLYQEVTSEIDSLTRQARSGRANIDSYSQHIHGLVRQLLLGLDAPSDTPNDFIQLQWAYAHLVYATCPFRQMPFPYFEEFLEILTTAYSMGRREGYSERVLEILLGGNGNETDERDN